MKNTWIIIRNVSYLYDKLKKELSQQEQFFKQLCMQSMLAPHFRVQFLKQIVVSPSCGSITSSLCIKTTYINIQRNNNQEKKSLKINNRNTYSRRDAGEGEKGMLLAFRSHSTVTNTNTIIITKHIFWAISDIAFLFKEI